ncbi:hypothetical protein FB107DRAFT_279526 [Schizophyllum commune]
MADRARIYSALNVPTVTAHPSPKTLQWTSDGQLCFLTRGAVYIMTPEHAITFDTGALLRPAPDPHRHAPDPHRPSAAANNLRSSAASSASASNLPATISTASTAPSAPTPTPTIGWFRTVIPIDKTIAYQWPEHSQAYPLLTLGAIDVSLWSLAVSPPGLGPLLATLTSNCDLTLWAAGRNGVRGEWVKLPPLTPHLLTLWPRLPVLARTLRAQVGALTWSAQPAFSIASPISPSSTSSPNTTSPASPQTNSKNTRQTIPTGPTPLPTHPPLDASLLILGTRAGVVVFLRHAHPTPTLLGAARVAGGGQWVAEVAVSGLEGEEAGGGRRGAEEPAETEPEEPAVASPEEPAETSPKEPAETSPKAPAETSPEAPAETSPEAPAKFSPPPPHPQPPPSSRTRSPTGPWACWACGRDEEQGDNTEGENTTDPPDPFAFPYRLSFATFELYPGGAPEREQATVNEEEPTDRSGNKDAESNEDPEEPLTDPLDEPLTDPLDEPLQGTLLTPPDGRRVGALSWVEVEGRGPTLVICKPGLVSLWSAKGAFRTVSTLPSTSGTTFALAGSLAASASAPAASTTPPSGNAADSPQDANRDPKDPDARNDSKDPDARNDLKDPDTRKPPPALTLPLPPLKTSIGSSAFSAVVGVHYVGRRDTLLLTLHDGTMRALRGLATGVVGWADETPSPPSPPLGRAADMPAPTGRAADMPAPTGRATDPPAPAGLSNAGAVSGAAAAGAVSGAAAAGGVSGATADASARGIEGVASQTGEETTTTPDPTDPTTLGYPDEDVEMGGSTFVLDPALASLAPTASSTSATTNPPNLSTPSALAPIAGPSSSNLNPSFATGAIGHIPRTTATRPLLPLTSAHLSAHTRAVFTTLEGGRAPGPRTDYRSESTAAIRVSESAAAIRISASTGPSINPSDAAPNLAVGEGGPGASGAHGAGAGGAPNGALGSGGAQGSASTDTAGRITKQDVNRITGMADYDGLGAMVWVYESARPADFNYKHDAKNGSTLVVSGVWEGLGASEVAFAIPGDDTGSTGDDTGPTGDDTGPTGNAASRPIRDPQAEEFLSLLTSTLNSTRASSSPAPLPLLRPLLFRLQDRALLVRVRERVLAVLSEGLEGEDVALPPSTTTTSTAAGESTAESAQQENPPQQTTSPALPTNPTPSLRAHFRESLARALFGGDELLRLRLKLAVADFMRKNLSTSTTSDPTAIPLSDPSVLAHAEATHLASALLAAIAHRVQGIVTQHVVAVVRFLGAPDLPFALRLALQATLPGSPSSLVSRGRELLHALRGSGLLSDADLASLESLGRAHGSQEGDVMQVDGGNAMQVDGTNTVQVEAGNAMQLDVGNGRPADQSSQIANDALLESCPACGQAVPLQGTAQGVCPSGHTWARCTTTTFLLSTPHVRTCLLCSRKALLPVSSAQAGSAYRLDFLPRAARCWVVDELLQSVGRCIVCGGGFVSVL